MRPAKVTAVMASPICGHVPMLDGVLSSLMGLHMSRIRGSRNGNRHVRPHGLNAHPNIPIPINIAPFGGWYIAQASSPIYETVGEDVSHVTRVSDFDLDAIRPGGANKINVTSGSFKGMRLPKRIITTTRVVWFVVAKADGSRTGGHMSALRKRLKKVEAIGGKTSIGHGRVAEWIVEPAEEDWSWFADSPDGPVLMRPLPVCDELPQALIGYKQWFGRPAAPYHDNATACEVVMPC